MTLRLFFGETLQAAGYGLLRNTFLSHAFGYSMGAVALRAVVEYHVGQRSERVAEALTPFGGIEVDSAECRAVFVEHHEINPGHSEGP